MNSFKRIARRGIATGVAGLLVASTAAVLAAPAQAAAPATGSLTWNISEQFVNHLSSRTLTGGVTFDETDEDFTFPAADVTEASDGTVTSSFNGSVRGAFAFGDSEFYSVVVADPVVEVDADGTGEVRATVSAANAAAQGNAAEETEPTEVTVAQFSGAITAGGTTTVTPDWEGVLPAGSPEAVALGITNPERPVNGKSFHPEFLGAITSGVRAHFHFTSGGDHKRPGDLSFTTAVDSGPSVTASVVDSGAKKGITVRVQGNNFDAESHDGAKGVYAVLAPADTKIDYSNWDSVDTLAAVSWIGREGDMGRTDTMVDGAFDIRLTAAPKNLEFGTEYAIFTWAAHVRGDNASQDTHTVVPVQWKSLKAKPNLSRKLNKAPKRKKAGKVTLTAQGRFGWGRPTGKVRAIIWHKGKKVATRNGTLNKKGKVSFKLPKGKVKNKKLRKGQHRVVLRYMGKGAYKKNQVQVKFRIK